MQPTAIKNNSTMEALPYNLLDQILFRLDPKSLAMMQCTGRYINSYISDDIFRSEYMSRVGTGLLHISSIGSTLLFCYPFRGSMLFRNQDPLDVKTRVLSICSGLLLLLMDGLCVINPLTKSASKLMADKKPLYLDGSLHWLRNDGSILAFNPETEQARLIPIRFPQELSVKTLFAAADNKLTLIWPTKEVIYVYSLENILTDPKWVLVRRMRNVMAEAKRLIFWDVVAYDGKVLMLREKNQDFFDGVVHRYDLRASEWGVMGYIPLWCCTNMDFYLYTPSVYPYVVGLDEKLKPCDGYNRISSLSSIMGLVVGISSEKVETQLRKRSIEEEETKLMLKKQRNY
ncbi:PREDICTED: putative F-box protein At1g20800 [Camelina sativa]|uniref:F-box protein At1g20800 n=1 Tax=Camelina sativa TaxID=90675 RepID=A0ABM1R5Y5_CAMSA|nr:PREDICTED: putative F-box protein At1g20800 [Camelina sativa]